MNILVPKIGAHEMGSVKQHDDVFENVSNADYDYISASYGDYSLQENDGTRNTNPNAKCRFFRN
jgi:hypothetical protein